MSKRFERKNRQENDGETRSVNMQPMNIRQLANV